MELNINEFKQRLEEEKAKGRSEAQLAAFIHKEIRLVETMKASIMEEMNGNTEEFLNEVTVKVDTYLFQLQELEHDLRSSCLPLDQKVALNDTMMREKIAGKMEELNGLDPEKYSEEGNTHPNEDSPLKESV